MGRGRARPGYSALLLCCADIILAGPTSPGTKAAIYQLLVGRPGLPVRANEVITTAVGDLAVFEQMGWVNQIGAQGRMTSGERREAQAPVRH